VPKLWLLGGWYPLEQIIHQQWYRPSDSKENVDIKTKNTYGAPEFTPGF
jgi:hypothetical protein